MKITAEMVERAEKAAPYLSSGAIVQLLEAALSDDVFPIPSLPWAIEESRSGGRRPVHFVSLVGADGETVASWMTEVPDDIQRLRAKARFLSQAVEAFCAN